MVRPRPHPSASTTPNEPLVLLKENRFAHTALGRLLRQASGNPVWLVFLYGQSGVGKSHLVRHFVRQTRRQHPRLRVRSETASEFVGKLSEAFSREQQAEFHAEYTSTDLLVLEDLAAIQSRSAAQRALVAILDELKRAGGRIVVTCSSPPGQLKSILPRLASRMRGGLCVPLELLDEASRLNFAKHLAASRQIPLSMQAAEVLAKEGPATPREILAALVNLDWGSRRKSQDSDASLMRAQLKVGQADRHSLSQIAKVVAKSFEIPLAQLRSTARQKRSILARQIAMLLARELSGRSAADIARFFGRKNHTTVVHACRRTRALLASDPALARDFERLRRTLRRQ